MSSGSTQPISQVSTTLVLDDQLQPLKPYMEKPSVTELMVNSDGSVWIDKAGRLTQIPYFSLSPHHRMSIIRELAGDWDLVCTSQSPTLACKLPGDIAGRVQAVIPPITEGPEICIRFPSRTKLSLKALVRKGTLTPAESDELSALVLSRRNIVIAGGTGSGKTTLAMALLDLLRSERICVIEDTPEIVLANKNTNYWLTSTTFTPRDAVKTSLRFRPDRIILGEIRDGGAALEWCKAAQSGHPGSICTIHASDAEGVKRRIFALMQEVVVTPNKELIDAAIDCVVFIAKTSRQSLRKVQRIVTLSHSSKETEP